MGVEAKKMANPVATSGEGFVQRVVSWIRRGVEQTKTFYNDVRTETKKVTAPSFKEVQSTTVVVIISVFLFAAFFEIVDLILSHSLDTLFRYLVRHGI